MAITKPRRAPSGAPPSGAPPVSASPSSPRTADRYQRWRLILGKRAEELMAAGRVEAGLGAPGESVLSPEMEGMDGALGAVYDVEEARPDEKGKRGIGLGRSRPKIATWLGDVRRYFERDVVAVIQQDAIEKRGWKDLLFEPEALAQATPSIELVATLLELKAMIPDETRETARQLIRTVVEDIQRRMEVEIEQAVRGAVDRSRRAPQGSLLYLDVRRTIGKNLKNYVPARRAIVPDRLFFHGRRQRRRAFEVIVCIDQSGSMAESVVHGSILGSILASLPSLSTHVVAFDTEVVDLTAEVDDPVEMLFGLQLGGGTDIDRAVGYCRGLIQRPERTLFLLLTDLHEGGDRASLARRMEEMTAAGVRAICLLALSDSGAPSHDAEMAKKLAACGVPCVALSPRMLPPLLEALLKGKDVTRAALELDARR
ncbi:MAG: VWA domain-containing protein [Byssovorax sp.]